MEKIYEQLKDLHVRNIIFYAADGDGNLYVDSRKTKRASLAQVKDAFIKRQLLINYEHVLLVPYSCALDGSEVDVYYGDSTRTFIAQDPEE